MGQMWLPYELGYNMSSPPRALITECATTLTFLLSAILRCLVADTNVRSNMARRKKETLRWLKTSVLSHYQNTQCQDFKECTVNKQPEKSFFPLKRRPEEAHNSSWQVNAPRKSPSVREVPFRTSAQARAG